MNHLIEPHGGQLVNLGVDAERRKEIVDRSKEWPSWDLTARTIRHGLTQLLGIEVVGQM